MDTQLQNVLKDLQKSTGLPLVLDETVSVDSEQALIQIRQLSNAYKEKYNADYFLQNLLSGQIPAFDVVKHAGRLHIDVSTKRCLFLIEVRSSLSEAILEILKNLFSSRSRQYIFTVDNHTIAFLKTAREQDSPDDMAQIARMVVDTLNMEAMAHVRVVYGSFFDQLSDLPEQYRENALALRVGDLFYSEQTVIYSHQLGTGRLIYELPKALCEEFLREIFKEESPVYFDEEMLTTLNKFFQNNLNIAETSRQLHVHRNTLIYRLEQLERRTGLDIRTFEDAMTLKIAMMIINYLNTERMNKNE